MRRTQTIDRGQRLPPSEFFSYDEDYRHKRRNKNSSLGGMGNDSMSKALNQISKSPFTHWIEGGKLPRRFTQPTFTLYNGRIDPIEHVSHFNQRMTVHSKNEALICKVFPSSLGLVAMRWFEGPRAGSIDSFKETHPSVWVPLYYMQQGSSAFGFLVIFVHERRRNLENIFRQILGDVQ